MTDELTEAVRLGLLKQGPFPAHVDPWVESERLFHMLHAALIGVMIEMTQDRLMALGYVAGRETSLQIVDGREPDIFVRDRTPEQYASQRLNYALAAAEVLAEPGVETHDGTPLEALVIRDRAGGLVTVVEVISPSNKTRDSEIGAYRSRRWQLFLQRDIRVVEIDLTRSVKRLVASSWARETAYHCAVFIPGDDPRVVQMPFATPLKRIALPLRHEVIAVDLHEAYVRAYQINRLAVHLLSSHQYAEESLPFPSLLSAEERQWALNAVYAWREQLSASG